MNLLSRVSQPKFESDGKRLSWYACLFDSPTLIHEYGQTYTEVIRPGAFTASLAGDGEVTANIDHDDKYKFAQRTDGSLLLQEDPKGLFCSCWVPGDIGEAVQAHPDRWGASFRFNPVESRDQGGVVERLAVVLADVCLTRNPAYPGTIGGVHVRTGDNHAKNQQRAAYLLLKARIARSKYRWV